MAETKNRALAKYDEPPAANIVLPSAFADIASSAWASFPLDSIESKARFLDAIQGASDPISDKIGEVIMVQDVLVHRVTIIDEKTGEVLDRDRIVMIQPDGKAFGCVSEGVRTSVAHILALFGVPPWTPALPIKVSQVNTRRGHRTYKFGIATGSMK